jgi:hypothetical protein
VPVHQEREQAREAYTSDGGGRAISDDYISDDGGRAISDDYISDEWRHARREEGPGSSARVPHPLGRPGGLGSLGDDRISDGWGRASAPRLLADPTV